jgi:hypothetical protein
VTLNVVLGDDRDAANGTLLYTATLPATAQKTLLPLELTIPAEVASGFLHFVVNDGTNIKYTSAQFPPGPIGWNLNTDGNWSHAAHWNVAVPNSTDAKAFFGAVTSAPRTVAADKPVTVGRFTFDNPISYTIAGGNAITLDVASGNAAINITRGSHTISAPVKLADNTAVTVSAADSNLSFAGGLTGSGALLKAGPGSMAVSSIRLPRLLVNEGAVSLLKDSGVSVLGALTVSAAPAARARLDLTNNAAIIDYTGTSAATALRQQILTGRDGMGLGGAWTGTGITSSTAAIANATGPDSRSIGYAENAAMPLGPLATFRGEPVDDTSILVAFTRTGDANLDGLVNDDDVTIVGASYAPGVAQPHWALGDFDYNGFVDDNDVTLLGAFYDPSASPLIAAGPIEETTIAAIPEPQTWTLVTCVAVVMLLLQAYRTMSK